MRRAPAGGGWLEPGCREALKVARNPGIMPWGEVPRYVPPHIQPGSESF